MMDVEIPRPLDRQDYNELIRLVIKAWTEEVVVADATFNQQGPTDRAVELKRLEMKLYKTASEL